MKLNKAAKSTSIALGVAMTSGISTSIAQADTNPFYATALSSGYMQVAEGKNGEGKCGADKMIKKSSEAKCGADKMKTKSSEAKCGADKMTTKSSEAKCGADKKVKKSSEGKCGEAKCGANK